MRAYQALLRLAVIETDARSRAVAEALEAEAAAQMALGRHDAMVIKERQAADNSSEAIVGFAAFFARSVRERARLVAAVEACAAAVGLARDALTSAMTEQRKMERLIELEQEREAAAEAYRERLALDEAATLRHARSGRSKPG